MKKNLFLFSLLTVGMFVNAADSDITFGYCQIDITPPVGCKLPFWKRKTNAVAVHDKLYAQCIAMKDAKNRIALFIGADMMYVMAHTAKAVRAHCKKKYNIKPSDIIFSASHTHNAPYTYGKYGSEVNGKIIKLVDNAIKNCKTAGCLRIARTTSNIGISRRFGSRERYKDKSGKRKIRYYYNDKLYFDPTLNILAFYDIKDKLRNFIWIYGCHTTGYAAYVDGKVQVSADWSGEIRRKLKQLMPAANALFMQGAGGDVKPRFIYPEKRNSKGHVLTYLPNTSLMQKFGEKYATKIAKFISTVKHKPIQTVSIESSLDTFTLTYDTNGAILKNKVKSLDYYQKLIKSPDTNLNKKAKYKRLVEKGWYKGGKPESLWQAQIIKLNDEVQILGLSGEPTSGVSKLLAKTFKDKTNIFVGYIRYGSYITDDEQQQQGGYEAKGYSKLDDIITTEYKKLESKIK